MLGSQVGSWLLQKLLGEGGMGRVYLAEHVVMKDQWAVKVLSDELTQREDVVRRFVNEARAAAKVRHRNLIRVFHIDQVPNGPWYMVLEYLQGTTLSDYLVSHPGPVPYGVVVRILAQVASALYTIHKHDIVHRDVKPENVFLVARENDEMFPIVLDLGVAFLANQADGVATRRGTAIGTLCYMPPEQLLGEKVDAAADVYALGVIAYQMSTGGWFPYQQDHESYDAYVRMAPAELFRRQTTEQIVDPRRRNPALTDAWALALYRLLAVPVAHRAPDARTAALELAKAAPADGARPEGLSIVRTYAPDLLQTDSLLTTLRSSTPAPIATGGGGESYVLGAKIGEGGMAEVFAGTGIGANGFEKRVAIKRVLSEFSSQPGFTASFIAEARLASHLSHANIVSVIQHLIDDQGRPFLVMELVEGKDLRALLDAGPLPPSLIIFVVVEILRGLGYAHQRLDKVSGARGLIHRDMSPENVLLSYEGDVKVNDFGLARMRDIHGRAGSARIAGKPRYMSPEQVRGEALDNRSDLWAVGVMLWEMLTGQTMLTGTPIEIMGQVQFKTIPRPSALRAKVPADLEAIAMRMLQRDVNARYQTAEQAIGELVRCKDAPANGPEELKALLAARFQPVASLSGALPRAPAPEPLPGPETRSMQAPTTLGAAATDLAQRGSAKPRRFGMVLASAVAFLLVIGAMVGITAMQRRTAARDALATSSSGSDAAAAGDGAAIASASAGGTMAAAGETLQSADAASGNAATTMISPPADAALGAAPPDAYVADAAPAPDARAVHAAPPSDARVVDAASPPDARNVPATTEPVARHSAPKTPSRPASPPAPAVTAATGEPGELVIVVKPWATITINNKSAGATPFRKALPSGRYVVKIANEDIDKEETMTVTIEPQKTLRIARTW
jgi:serine/threonine protein kinase